MNKIKIYIKKLKIIREKYHLDPFKSFLVSFNITEEI